MVIEATHLGHFYVFLPVKMVILLNNNGNLQLIYASKLGFMKPALDISTTNSSEPDDQPTDVATFCRFEVWDSNYEANEPCALQFLGVLVDLKESSGRSMIYL